jgi:LPS-assembly protein
MHRGCGGLAAPGDFRLIQPLRAVAAKRALLAGAALAVLVAPAAQAQTTPRVERSAPVAKTAPLPTTPSPTAPAPRQTRTIPGPDGLVQGELYMEADEVLREDKIGRTTAKGNIEVRYNSRTLRADSMVYDEKANTVRAMGHVEIIGSDGSSEFADEVVLDDEMKAGVASGFSARLPDNVKIAAASAVKRNEDIEELNKAIYTPCEICNAKGQPKTPSWWISADHVVRNKQKRIVYYKNARFHIFNVPVAYLPIFWHADPESERASGFLVPKASASNRRGFSYEQPYYWVISPSMDVTISPQINTKVNPFLNLQVRKAFYSGEVDLRFGYTHENDFDGRGNQIPGTNTDRSYILGSGAFQLTDKWRWGFTAERASDDLIFDKYEIGHVNDTRGPYIADDRRLISEVYTARQDVRSYLSVAAMTIQGLRPGDVDRTFPLVAPLVESHFEPGSSVLGGRLRLHGSAVSLQREQAPMDFAVRVPGVTAADLTTRLPGLDSERVTGEVDWRRTFTSAAGVRAEPFVWLRADAYRLQDILDGPNGSTHNRSLSRGLATVGMDVSYPVYRRTSDSTVVLEPVAQVAASPDARQIVVGRDASGKPIYLNEDSVAFEFDENTLFRANKFPGYDLYEDGLRLNVAGRAAVLWDDGRRANVLIGRSFRTGTNDNVFSPRSGLTSNASDWIVAGDAQPLPGVSVFARARLDNNSLDVHRLEAGANVGNKYGNGFVRYLRDDQDINGKKVENFDVGGEVYGPYHLGVSFYGNRDLARDAWVIRDLGVFYKDDCLRVDVIYRREDIIIGRLRPSNSVTVRLTLATLGGTFGAR